VTHLLESCILSVKDSIAQITQCFILSSKVDAASTIRRFSHPVKSAASRDTTWFFQPRFHPSSNK
jgi:hypothetical protein